MRKSWLVAITIALVAGAWLVSGQLMPAESEGTATDAAGAVEASMEEAEPALSQVRVQPSVARPVTNTLLLQGRTVGERAVDLRAETDGIVAEVRVERGAAVEAGQIIAGLTVDDRQARLSEARAWLTQREIEFSAASTLNESGYRADTALAAAQAALDAARAMVEIAQVEFDNIRIKAPFAGIIDDRMIEVGDFVSKGEPVAKLVDLDPIRVVGQVSERHLGAIEIGLLADVRMVDGTLVTGVVSFVGTVADETTRTIPIEVEVDNEARTIIQGITAELHLPLAEVMAHPTSPAVLTLADDGTVGVRLVEDGVVRFAPVSIAASDAEGVWLAGLPPMIDLIVVGQEYVRDGDPVEAVTQQDIDAAFAAVAGN